VMVRNSHQNIPDIMLPCLECLVLLIDMPNFCLDSLKYFAVITRSPGILVHRFFCRPCRFDKITSYMSGTSLHKTSRQDPFNSLVTQSLGHVRIFRNQNCEKLLKYSHQIFHKFSTQETCLIPSDTTKRGKKYLF
jgi:hypothetical protein